MSKLLELLIASGLAVEASTPSTPGTRTTVEPSVRSSWAFRRLFHKGVPVVITNNADGLDIGVSVQEFVLVMEFRSSY